MAKANESLRPRVVPYVAGVFSMDASRRWIGGMVLLLAALLLLPPCANIGILVYARAVTRREEFATRYALGASRGRIVTQIFVEVLVLAAAAGMVGLLFASQFAFAERLSAAVMPTMGPGNRSLLVRLPSLTERGAVPGWTGRRRRRNRRRRPRHASHGPVAAGRPAFVGCREERVWDWAARGRPCWRCSWPSPSPSCPLGRKSYGAS